MKMFLLIPTTQSTIWATHKRILIYVHGFHPHRDYTMTSFTYALKHGQNLDLVSNNKYTTEVIFGSIKNVSLIKLAYILSS